MLGDLQRDVCEFEQRPFTAASPPPSGPSSTARITAPRHLPDNASSGYPHRTTIVWIKLTQAHGMDQLRPPVLSLLVGISDPSDR
ncbi:hypothetical protein [Streptomyces coeruleorubidus]|uniref:hypothetical protein n=1 Tax=Streptomyces coeruleorubidus TaxID=116188 RepID=UPI0036673732